MAKDLIVNADDYGRSAGVSAGIRKAHAAGIVSSSTVMINMPHAVEDVRLARLETPQLALGVHLNLTVGRPCAPIAKVPSLVGTDDFFHNKTTLHQHPQRLAPQEVALEWSAQVETFLATGATLDHLDSHHHIALLSPQTWQACLATAETHGCGLRAALPVDVDHQTLLSSFPPLSLPFITQRATNLLTASGRPHVAHFYAGFFGGQATRRHLLAILMNLPPGTSELMCHPGYADSALLESSRYTHERETELELLTAPDVMQALQAAGIHLCSYRDLWPQ